METNCSQLNMIKLPMFDRLQSEYRQQDNGSQPSTELYRYYYQQKFKDQCPMRFIDDENDEEDMNVAKTERKDDLKQEEKEQRHVTDNQKQRNYLFTTDKKHRNIRKTL
ncbi:unnamed protein product [Rotaria sp. Silwood2]|nr:unnamed protein product [Rotaria sp. Silwood2]CAF3595161.1 unnamed protein product [Rotaria sp. Silwood2]CAF4795345.1 unnamed protein product [Rotaria sp. Silwood2]CAF4857060.1 unnamed protein product [Rotaria sp. Silwood2]